MRVLPRVCLLLSVLCAAACVPLHAVRAQQAPPGGAAQPDTLDPLLVPAGFGSLRQDDLSLKVAPSTGLQVRATPLDERFIRLLSPDSYRAMRELVASKQAAIQTVKDRQRLPAYALWYVSFFAMEQGETRFSPQEFLINNTGRDFRPVDVLPMTAGFGEYRLRQREVQSAIFVFDGAMDLNQPTSAIMEGTPSATDWGRVLQLVERERSLVRSRAAAGKRPTN